MISDIRFPITAWVKVPEAGIKTGGAWRRQVTLPVRVLRFHHAKFGLCQIDTGYTPRIWASGRSLAVRLYAAAVRPHLVGQDLPKLDHLFLSHFHADHACGLADFLPATIWADAKALQHWQGKSALARVAHGVFSSLWDGVAVQTMDADVFGDGSLRALPLPGHQMPHYGFEFPEHGLLYGVDADFTRAGGGFLRQLFSQNRRAATQTARRVSDYPGRVVLCHDPNPEPEDC